MHLAFRDCVKSTFIMGRLKHANDEKSTTGGREFHTFITLSAKKFLRAVFVVCGLYSLYT